MSHGPLMALDSAGLWFRAFHSVPEKITGPHGRPVNAVRGFLDMTAALVDTYSPTGLVAATDEDWRPGWRVEKVPSYKTQRVAESGEEDAPDALAPQVDTIRDLLDAGGVCRAGAAGAEADDVLAAIAGAGLQGREVLVVTGDRDLFQLAAPGVRVVYVGAGMKKQQAFGPAEVAERIGLPAAEDARAYADYAVLVGDASDGLPGVPGIGAKTAAALVSRYGDLETLLAAAGSGDAGLTARQRTALVDSADYVRAAAEVVRLHVRPVDPEFTGERSGALGPGDPDRWHQLVADNGIENVAERFTRALAGLDRA